MSKNHFVLFAIWFFSVAQVQALSCSNDLEESLAQLPQSLTAVRATQGEIELDAQCISASMDVFYEWTNSVRIDRATKKQPEVGHYGYCKTSDQSSPERRHTPPCKSETYIAVVQNAYNDVIRCLDMDPKKLFVITAVESGFHINTYSLTGQDIGIGQLIPEAIREVNAFWAQSLTELSQSENPFCVNLRPLLEGLTSAPSEGPGQACSMMALPENPIRNLLYKGLLHKFHEQQMIQYFNQARISERLAQLSGEEWTTEQLTALQEVLVFLSYNAGFHGARQIFESFLAEKQLDFVAWNQQYDQLYQLTIDHYLRAMDLESKGQNQEALYLMESREQAFAQMQKLKEDQVAIHIPKVLFLAGTTPGSFGDYLMKSNSSNYLNILLGRIEYIEKDLLNRPGLCAPPGFLKDF